MKPTVRHLPRQVDAFKLTQQAIVLDGQLRVNELPRLTEALSSTTGLPDLHPVLSFGIDAEGHRVAEGQVKAMLPITCQRCLQVMPYEVQADIHWAFVTSDEAAKKLPAHLDPIMLSTSGYVDVYEMLEDELLLSLPITAFHEDCEGAGATKVFGEVVSENASATEKPFAALADLFEKNSFEKTVLKK